MQVICQEGYQIEIFLKNAVDFYNLPKGGLFAYNIDGNGLNLEVIVNNFPKKRINPEVKLKDFLLSVILHPPYNPQNLNDLKRKIPKLLKKFPENYILFKII